MASLHTLAELSLLAARTIRKFALWRLPVPGVLRTRCSGRSAADRGTMFLTFDDGPHPVLTPGVLRTLDAYRQHSRDLFLQDGD